MDCQPDWLHPWNFLLLLLHLLHSRYIFYWHPEIYFFNSIFSWKAAVRLAARLIDFTLGISLPLNLLHFFCTWKMISATSRNIFIHPWEMYFWLAGNLEVTLAISCWCHCSISLFAFIPLSKHSFFRVIWIVPSFHFSPYFNENHHYNCSLLFKTDTW